MSTRSYLSRPLAALLLSVFFLAPATVCFARTTGESRGAQRDTTTNWGARIPASQERDQGSRSDYEQYGEELASREDNSERGAVTHTLSDSSARKAITFAENGQCTQAWRYLHKAMDQMQSGQNGAYVAGSSRGVVRAVRVVYDLCNADRAQSHAEETLSDEKTATPKTSVTTPTTTPTTTTNNGNCGIHKNRSSWGSSCPDNTQIGHLWYQCYNGEIVDKSSCTAAPACGADHLEGTTWDEAVCPSGSTGTMTYTCFSGGRHFVSDQCTLLPPVTGCPKTTVNVAADNDASKVCAFGPTASNFGASLSMSAGSNTQGAYVEGTASFHCQVDGTWTAVSSFCHVYMPGETTPSGNTVGPY